MFNSSAPILPILPNHPSPHHPLYYQLTLAYMVKARSYQTKKKMIGIIKFARSLVRFRLTDSQTQRLICQPLLFLVPIKGAYTAEKDSGLNPIISVL